MTWDELKMAVSAHLPEAAFEEGGEWISVDVPPEKWSELARALRTDRDLLFDYLFCVTCVDWKTHLTMVYHLTSKTHRHTLVIKSKLDRNNPEIGSVSSVWRTAEFHERESYEMFGVRFIGHPDLRLLILPDGWEGRCPMRKDFEDPVNMIRL
jgi:NADH:ubiquinone oxidoreductase subunit C